MLGRLLPEEEQSVYPVPGGERDPAYDQELRAHRIGSDYPLALAAGAESFENLDDGFAAGLDAIIVGVEVTLLARRRLE